MALRVTPARAAGITDHIWTMEDLVSLRYSSFAASNFACAATCRVEVVLRSLNFNLDEGFGKPSSLQTKLRLKSAGARLTPKSRTSGRDRNREVVVGLTAFRFP